MEHSDRKKDKDSDRKKKKKISKFFSLLDGSQHVTPQSKWAEVNLFIH